MLSESEIREQLIKLCAKMEWETVDKCNFCGSTENDVYLDVDANVDFNGKKLRLVKCQNCDLVYASPRPTFESIRMLFSDEVTCRYRIEKKLNRPDIMNVHKKAVELAMFYHDGEPKSLFDVGTGAGTVLMVAKNLGLEVLGNEINRYSNELLVWNHISCYNIPTCELNLNRKFDIVTCFDYIEHTYTPYEDLKWIVNHINQDGILYLKTLWLECPNHLKMGTRWNLFGGQHYYYYYPKVIRKMIESVGFSIINTFREPAIIHIIAKKT